MANFSLIIPTYNRPYYLKRILSYYNDWGENCQIIVADSSLAEYKKENKKIIPLFPDLDVLYLDKYSETTNMFHKIADATDYIRSKYCVLCSDDDFVIPKGIKQSIDFLEKNPDFTVVQGFYINFRFKNDKNKFYWASGPNYRSIIFSDPRQRLNFHFLHYHIPTFHAVHKTEFLKMIFKESVRFINDTRFGELLPSMLALIYGKMKRLDVLYITCDSTSVPMVKDQKYFYRLQHFIEEGTYDKKYAKFRNCLAFHLSKVSQLDIEESKKVVDEAVAGYLKSDYKDVLLNKMKYILDSLNAPDWVYKKIKSSLRSIYVKFANFKKRKRYSNSTDNLPAKYLDDFNKLQDWIISYSEKNNTMKSAIFITARTKSTRLPKKVLLEIKGKAVIEHLIDRLKLAKTPDLIVLCTSTNPNDDILVEIAKKNKIEYFRGSEDDVLDRFLKAASLFKVDFIVVTWGDEPFCDPEYIDKTIKLFKKTNADFIKTDGLPLGTFSYGLKMEALKKVCQIKKQTDTEIWGDYFAKTSMFKIENLEVDDSDLRHPEIRVTIDYPEDFEFAKEIFKRLYKKDRVFSLKEILKLLKEQPELTDINKNCQELYEKNIKRLNKAKINYENKKRN